MLFGIILNLQVLKMKHLVIIFLLVSIPLHTHSQGTRPQNVYRVTVTSRYVLEGFERTSRFFAVNQEIYDSLGRLHTEIDFDWETRYPNNYRWHYFDSLLKVRTEYYTDEMLDRRVVLEYTSDTLVARELHYRPVNGDTILTRTIDYSYNSGGLPLQKEALSDRGRRLYRSRIQYDDRGTEVRRRVNTGRGVPDDQIRRLDRETEYDSAGLLVSEKVSLRMTDRSRRVYSRNYNYDDNGNMTGMTEFDDKGNQLRRTEYVWQSGRNRLQRIITYDAGDNMEMYLAKRYEIYRTSDRRHRVIDY